MPIRIIWTKTIGANDACTRWVKSQHSVLQSISKNTVPFASSVHMNISISIEITEM